MSRIHPLIQAAVTRERIAARANEPGNALALHVIETFEQSKAASAGSDEETEAVVLSLRAVLRETARRSANGQRADRQNSFCAYEAALKKPESVGPNAHEAADITAAAIKGAGGLVEKKPNGAARIRKSTRDENTIYASDQSVAFVETETILALTAQSALRAEPGIRRRRARLVAAAALRRHGLTESWTRQKNGTLLRRDTNALMQRLPVERRSLAVHNSLVPMTSALNAVIKRTPAVALLWLDTIRYAVRQSAALRNFTNARSPSDIVSSMKEMSGLAAGPWRILATTDAALITMMLDQCADGIEKEQPPLADLSAEQLAHRTPVYDFMRLQSLANMRFSDPVAKHIWAANFQQAIAQRRYRPDPLTAIPLIRAYAERLRATTAEPDNRNYDYLNTLDWADNYLDTHTSLPKLTWEQYLEISDRWHQQLRLRGNTETLDPAIERLTWSSALQEFNHNGYTVIPLNSQRALAHESERMDHCVGYGSYAQRCAQNTSRIFHIARMSEDSPPTPVATAQIVGGLRPGDWTLAQLQGPHNSTNIPEDARKLARTLPERYNQAARESR